MVGFNCSVGSGVIAMFNGHHSDHARSQVFRVWYERFWDASKITFLQDLVSQWRAWMVSKQEIGLGIS